MSESIEFLIANIIEGMEKSTEKEKHEDFSPPRQTIRLSTEKEKEKEKEKQVNYYIGKKCKNDCY